MSNLVHGVQACLEGPCKSSHHAWVSTQDGFSAQEIFSSAITKSGYTYDDLICLPGHINFGVHDVNLTTRILVTEE